MDRKIRIIVNQAARRAGKDSIVAHLEREFADFDVDIRVPETYEDTVQAATSASADGITDLVVVGGDGTINMAVNAIGGSEIRLGIIPSGTANDLATHLGLPSRLRAACAVIREGGTRRLDLVEVNGKFYATAGGMGVVSKVATNVNDFKATSGGARSICRALGSLVYILYSFVVLLFSRQLHSKVNITCDGENVGDFRSVALFVNNQPTIGKTAMPCPSSLSDDGKIEGLMLDRRSRLGTILTVILMTLKGSHTKRRDAIPFSGGEIRVTSENKQTFIGDGEVLAFTRNLRLCVRPGALRVLVS